MMDTPLLLPTPQYFLHHEGAYSLPSPLKVRVLDAKSESAVKFLEHTLKTKYSIAVTRVNNTSATISFLPLEATPNRAEGYRLEVSDKGITISGYDAAGSFYGVQTLLQLIQQNADGTLQAPRVSIEDFPYKFLRGFHCYMPGREGIPFFKRWLDLLASFKMNTLFLEVGAGMRYERHPKINSSWEKFCKEVEALPNGPYEVFGGRGRVYPLLKDSTHTELGGGSFLEKHEVAELLEYARSLHIEVIPEVQALSHAYYLCNACPELAELSDDPYPDTYCPSNPRSYEILFDVMDEVIEVFKPRVMHVGHDEVYHMGHCPRCKDTHPSELLAGELLEIHGYLAKQNIRMAMWGDKLLPFSAGGQGGIAITHTNSTLNTKTVTPETYQAIDKLPRDILIAEWLINQNPMASEFFKEQGFDFYCGNFGDNFQAHAFPRWHVHSPSSNMVGGQVPTWVDVSEFGFGYNGVVFNTLFSAELLWWSHYRDSERTNLTDRIAILTYNAREYISGEVSQPKKISEKLELPLASLPFVPSLSGLVLNTTQSSSTLTLQKQISKLTFRHTCETTQVRNPTWGNVKNLYKHPDENLLANHRVHYDDGSSVDIPIHYGSHVAAWNIPYGEDIDAVPYWADPVNVGRSPSGQSVTLYDYTWHNPFPEKRVEDVRLEYAGPTDGTVWVCEITYD
jgi:hypothetical protein